MLKLKLYELSAEAIPVVTRGLCIRNAENAGH